jgi:hypothetical protein
MVLSAGIDGGVELRFMGAQAKIQQIYYIGVSVHPHMI